MPEATKTQVGEASPLPPITTSSPSKAALRTLGRLSGQKRTPFQQPNYANNNDVALKSTLRRQMTRKSLVLGEQLSAGLAGGELSFQETEDLQRELFSSTTASFDQNGIQYTELATIPENQRLNSLHEPLMLVASLSGDQVLAEAGDVLAHHSESQIRKLDNMIEDTDAVMHPRSKLQMRNQIDDISSWPLTQTVTSSDRLYEVPVAPNSSPAELVSDTNSFCELDQKDTESYSRPASKASRLRRFLFFFGCSKVPLDDNTDIIEDDLSARI